MLTLIVSLVNQMYKVEKNCRKSNLEEEGISRVMDYVPKIALPISSRRTSPWLHLHLSKVIEEMLTTTFYHLSPLYIRFQYPIRGGCLD